MSDQANEHIRAYVESGLGSRYVRALERSLDVGPTEMVALLHLARGELTAGQLSHALVLPTEDMTALIDRLEVAGHVVRHPDAQDPGMSAIALSESTLMRLAALTRPLVEELDALAAGLEPQERAAVGRFLEAVTLISEREAERAARAALEGKGGSEGRLDE